VEAALKNRQTQFVIDDEAIILGVDGNSDFDVLHSGRHNGEVQLCAFDVLAIGGQLDAQSQPGAATRGRPDGIFNNPYETGAIGPDLFRAACRMGLEGLFSKCSDRPYQAGRSKLWVKVKNRAHPAMYRVMDALA
jgi:bifunctional non-homologous end joining protein LigD